MVARRRETLAHPVDIHVGSRVRLRRIYLGHSQEHIAKALGVTFQQIQKYEKGSNRISSSKLFEIATLLGVPPAFFFEGAEEAVNRPTGKMPGNVTGSHEAKIRKGEEEVMSRREALNVVTHYYAIPDKHLRRGVLALIKALGKPENEN